MTQSCRQTQTADSGGKRVYERNSIARQQESVLEGVVHGGDSGRETGCGGWDKEGRVGGGGVSCSFSGTWL